MVGSFEGHCAWGDHLCIAGGSADAQSHGDQ